MTFTAPIIRTIDWLPPFHSFINPIETWEIIQRTFSISLSLPRLVPRPGTDICRSSLSRGEPRSEPRLFKEFFAFFWRKAPSASRRRFIASSLLSSLNFRRRSLGTQSSHLFAQPLANDRHATATKYRMEVCMVWGWRGTQVQAPIFWDAPKWNPEEYLNHIKWKKTKKEYAGS